MCLSLLQRGLQPWGGGGEAGRPDRVPETTQHFAEQEAAQPHCSAMTMARPPPIPSSEPDATQPAWEPEPSALLPQRRWRPQASKRGIELVKTLDWETESTEIPSQTSTCAHRLNTEGLSLTWDGQIMKEEVSCKWWAVEVRGKRSHGSQIRGGGFYHCLMTPGEACVLLFVVLWEQHKKGDVVKIVCMMRIWERSYSRQRLPRRRVE